MFKKNTTFLNFFKNKFTNLKYFLGFVIETIINLTFFFKQKQVTLIVLLRQILFTGVEALILIAITSVVLSGMIIIQGSSIAPNFVSSPLLYTILISIVTRELATLLTSLYIISRSGAAIATELGNMVINEEVDALISIGISPIIYLVIPRLIGVMVSVFTLSVYFNIFSLISSAILTQYLYDLPFVTFINQVFNELTLTDIASSSLKALTFGFFAAIIPCYHGLQVIKAKTEVPQRTSKAVVQTIVTIIIFDIFITILFYVK
jgi:phospholipid/cholesterol/gamma-HCH transport system permease protein